jgi:hypothetical protein
MVRNDNAYVDKGEASDDHSLGDISGLFGLTEAEVYEEVNPDG